MNYTDQQLIEILDRLRSQPAENEILEFKKAENGYDFSKIGQYFSALSNEANLKGQPNAWLIFGIDDKTHQIVGSNFRRNRKDLDSLKGEIAKKITNQITFIEIYELMLPRGRVVMFQIPSAPLGIPLAFEGHYYGRNGESLTALNLEEIERIRIQNRLFDWSSSLVPNATLEDLDPEAIEKARTEFKEKYPAQKNQIDNWDDATFLNKAKITLQGKITNAAIILLGRPESSTLLSPSVAMISWILKDDKNREKDYKHFGPPYLLNAKKVLENIRNLTIRHLPSGTIFPLETSQYDPWVLREALNNCIAHQDYTLYGRINVVETPSKVLFTNVGSFLPGNVENVIRQDAPQDVYRNRFLAEAMVNLNMIDVQGGGIKKMFETQMRRFFPLPDYDLSHNDRVFVTIRGEIIDERYTQLLIARTDLDLWSIILLDKVQKNIRIDKEKFLQLKTKGAVEGRYPNIYVSSLIAKSTADEVEKSQYIKQRGFNDDHYRKMILDYIKTYGSATRKDIDLLVFDLLPQILAPNQKKDKIDNLIRALRKTNLIKNTGSIRKPCWILEN